MLENKEDRANVVKSILAGSMVLVGLASGNASFFTLLVGTSVGIGGNLLSNVAESAYSKWIDYLFPNNGVIDDHIKVALERSFVFAVRRLEAEWKKSNNYYFLIHTNQHERAELSLKLIKDFKNDSAAFMQEKEKWELLLQNEILQNITKSTPNEIEVQDIVNNVFNRYFGIIEPLAKFAKANFVTNWTRSFHHFIQSEQGVEAWRACQQIWQNSLLSAVQANQNQLIENADSTSEIKKEINQIHDWLKKWDKDVGANKENNLSSTFISKTIHESFHNNLEPYRNQLKSIEENTQKLLETSFVQKFAELDPNETLLNFIQKELLRDLNVNLEQAGHQSEEDVALSKVFIDLPVSKRELNSNFNARQNNSLIISELIDASSLPLDLITQQMSKTEVNAGDFWREDKAEGRYVLIGGPGQGKTTIGQLACQLFRAMLLQKNSSNTWKVNRIVSQFLELCNEENIKLPISRRIPFRIILSEFAESLASPTNNVNSILSYISQKIQERTNQEFTSNNLRTWLGKFPWFLVLDGLDEVPASSNRDEVLNAIEDFWVDVDQKNADIMVLATTRPQGYNDEFSSKYYTHRYLIPLSNEFSLKYGRRLAKVKYKNDQDREEKILKRLSNAVNEETTARLMRSPLQVTIMTALLGRIGSAPQERWTLFNQYYTVIYQRETERNTSASRILRQYEPDINAIHYRVGLLLQIESELPEHTSSKLSLERFASLVENRLLEEGHSGKSLELLKKEIIDAAMNRLVFLVGVSAGEIGFEIRSLQEFMAAESLLDEDNGLIEQRIEAIAPSSHWQNVFLFVVGKSFAKIQSLRNGIYAICASLNESSDSKNSQNRALMIGSYLAVEILEEGILLRQPKFANLFLRLATQILIFSPNQIHNRIANLYKEEYKNSFYDELNMYLGLPFPQNLGAWAVVSAIESRELSDLFVERYWPKEKSEQLKILQILDDHNIEFRLKRTKWFRNRFSNNFYEYSIDDLWPLQNIRRELGMPFPWNTMDRHRRARARHFRRNHGRNEFKMTIDPDLEIILHYKIEDGTAMLKRLSRKGELSVLFDQQEIHQDWLPIISAKRFLDDPSENSFIKEMNLLSTSLKLPLSPKQSTFYNSILPWPFLMILKNVNTTEGVSQIIDKFENLGILSKYSLGEAIKIWDIDTVTTSDFSQLTDEAYPFSLNTSFQFQVSPFIHELSIRYQEEYFDKGLEYFFMKINSLYFEPNQTKIKEKFSEITKDVISKGIYREGLIEILEEEELLFLTKHDYLIDRGISIAFVIAYWELCKESDFIEFVNYFSERFTTIRLPTQNDSKIVEMINTLTRTFLADPTSLGVFVGIYKLCRIIAKPPQIPEDIIINLKCTEEQHYVSKFLVRFMLHSNADQDLEALANELLEQKPYQLLILHELHLIIRRINIDQAKLKSFLIFLYDAFTRENAFAQKEATLTLMKSFSSGIKSNLFENWEKLSLPEGLDKLIIS